MAAALRSHQSRNLVEVANLSKLMPYPENRATLDGLLIPVCRSKLFMGDLDYNQTQPNQEHDVADDIVVPNGAENRANHDNENMVHIVNRREWTEEQNHRIVKIDTEERTKGKGFMRRVKQQWDATYPTDPRTAQNLIDNAKRFKKEGWGTSVNISQDEVEEQVQPQTDDTRTSLEWTTEMKIVLMILDQEKRAKGRGFMKRVKDRWDVKYPEYQSASWQKLRDNAARFKKDPELKDLILVRQREEIQRAETEMRNEEEEHNVDQPGEERNGDEQIDVEQNMLEADDEELGVEVQIDVALTEKDKELERFFNAELEQLNHSTALHMEPREKLPKVKLDTETHERANKVLNLYLPNVDTIFEITDMVYAMGKAVAYMLGVKPKEKNQRRAKKAEGGNRRERKLKAEMKRLRQDIARAGNELHRRKQ